MTLARKHKSTVAQMAERFTRPTITKSGKVTKCIGIVIERPDKPSLYALFGGLSLRTNPFVEIKDVEVNLDHRIGRTELLTRMAANECEICGSKEGIEVHHVRKMADLKVKGRRTPPVWQQVMAARRRKTLVVCAYCHYAIHQGIATRTRNSNG